ncbi:MAG TPA: hypothetical protein VKC15_12550 [Gemmatimonadales bacterium]|nr:hypothetical protein [Gemmatimonadales bacterium]
MSKISDAADAARAAIAGGAAPAKLAEPKIGGAGAVPRAGAGAHEGERPAAPAGAPKETSVTFLEDREVEDALEEMDREGGGEGEQEAEGGEEGEKPAPKEGEAGQEGEQEEVKEGEEEPAQPFEIPAIREGEQPITVDIDDPEIENRIRALVRGNLRRENLHAAMETVTQREEHLAQFEDALRVDPVSLVIERTNPKTQADLALHLYTLPHVQQALREAFGEEGDDATLRTKGLELENQRLSRRSETVSELNRRSDYRARGREVRQGIQRIIPDDMPGETAQLLAKDLERDVTEYILANPRAANLRVDDLPGILERRLALHGITLEEAAERLKDTGIAPLPPGARSAARGNGAPARKPGTQPARTGKDVVAAANARRRAGAVPGGGAGIPAAGVVLPRKQGVKARIASIREFILGGG